MYKISFYYTTKSIWDTIEYNKCLILIVLLCNILFLFISANPLVIKYHEKSIANKGWLDRGHTIYKID